MNLNCYADGYIKIYNRQHQKIYVSVVKLNGRIRFSARLSRRASDAVAYGDRLVDRYLRLKAIQKVEA